MTKNATGTQKKRLKPEKSQQENEKAYRERKKGNRMKFFAFFEQDGVERIISTGM
jgi:hypothetical protein